MVVAAIRLAARAKAAGGEDIKGLAWGALDSNEVLLV